MADRHHLAATTLLSLSWNLQLREAAKRRSSSCMSLASGRAWGEGCAPAYTDATTSESDAYDPWAPASATCCVCAGVATWTVASG